MTDLHPSQSSEGWRETAINSVRDYLTADPERCYPTCRVGCPCDGGMEDSATGAPEGAEEIVDLVLSKVEVTDEMVKRAALAMHGAYMPNEGDDLDECWLNAMDVALRAALKES